MWCARAPDAPEDDFFPVYVGSSKKLRSRLGDYVHNDGTFGPKNEVHKYNALKDLDSRGFDLQIRHGVPSDIAIHRVCSHVNV
jgi:hypothetical protein